MGAQRGPYSLFSGIYEGRNTFSRPNGPNSSITLDFKKENVSDLDLKQNKPFEYLTKVATEKKSRLSDITQFNMFQKDLLTINETGRVQLTKESFDKAGSEGFDANVINEGLREQYLAFYSPEVQGNVLGTIVDGEFSNNRLAIDGLYNIGLRGSTTPVEYGFITDTTQAGGSSFSNFGFKDPTFNTAEQIETTQEAFQPGVRFERSSINIFSGAIRDREFKTGQTLSKNILSGATTSIGSDRSNDLLGVNKDK